MQTLFMLGKSCILRPHPNCLIENHCRKGHWGKQRCAQGLCATGGRPLCSGIREEATRITSTWPVSGLYRMEMLINKGRPSSVAPVPKHLIVAFHMASISCPRRAVRELLQTDRKHCGPWLGMVEIHRKGQI